MEVNTILIELYSELSRIDQAILALLHDHDREWGHSEPTEIAHLAPARKLLRRRPSGASSGWPVIHDPGAVPTAFDRLKRPAPTYGSEPS